MSINCFVTEEGVERNADLEDLLPVIGNNRRALQYILREANRSRINLAGVIAYLPDEMKEMVYNNVSPRVSGRLKKQVSYAEAAFGRYYAKIQKEKLIQLIGKRERIGHFFLEYPKHIVWKEAKPYEEKEEHIITNNSFALDSILQDGKPTDNIDDINDTDDAFTELVLIPEEEPISYRDFCNSYNMLVMTILRLNEKAWSYGLLSLEEELCDLSDGFFKLGLGLVVNGTDAEPLRRILTMKMEREHNFYRKKLMEVAMEGILCIQAGETELPLAVLLASLVEIKDNPLEAACEKYLSGDIDAFSGIDYAAIIKPEEEREEIRFIKRAMQLSETARREGIFALEGCLDHERIAGRDVFEYGLVFVVDGWDHALMEKVLDSLIERETDPVKKNIARAKKEAVMAISGGDNRWVLHARLCAYFGEGIERETSGLLFD